jgi:hypothetical protein
MPYLSTDHAKQIRTAIRKTFPEYKISVSKDNNTIRIKFKSGPIQLMNDSSDGYETVNQFYIKEHYTGEPEKVLSTVYNIANGGNYTEVVDGDYGAVPAWYVRITIGDWDEPYVVKN